MESSCPLRVITVAYNPGDELHTFADSLAQATSHPYELVICDNGQDSTVVDAVAEKSNARVIRSGENLGYGKAVNAGAREYHGQWFVVANPDVRFEAGAIDELLETASTWGRAGVLGPQILTPEGDIYPSARRFPRLIAGVGHAVLGIVWKTNPFSKHYHGNNTPGLARVTEWLSGACLLVRREAFDEVGGFDDNYFMFFEDTQLGKDMHERGWQSVYVPRAQVTHDQGKSWREQPASMIKAHHESAEKYLLRTYSQPWQAPVRLCIRAGLRLRLYSHLKLSQKEGRGTPSKSQ